MADDDPLVFDGLKKKKKKSKPKTEETVEEGLAATTSSPVSTPSASAAADDASEDINSMFADLKKKKKKKKPDLADFEAKMKAEEEGEGEEEQGDGAAANDDNDAAGGSLEEEGGDGDDDGIFQRDGDDMDASSESTQLKASGSSSSSGAETWLGTNRDYTYQELLSRFFRILRQNNPELVGEKKKYTIVPPSVHREGAKKTVFANIADICKRMRRPPEHCIQYLFAELGTTGSVDGSQRLMIKGRFQQKQIENVLKKYIVEYVTCKTCKSADTLLTKENRLFFLQCESCGSTRTVSAIKTGFMAQTQRRAAVRNAAG